MSSDPAHDDLALDQWSGATRRVVALARARASTTMNKTAEKYEIFDKVRMFKKIY